MPKFIIKGWIEVHDQTGNADNRHKPSKKIGFKTSMLQLDVCDYSDTNNDAYVKKLAFKNNSSLISCISKVNNTLIHNGEDLDIVVPMYNLIEYRKNYSKMTRRLWNYYRDKRIVVQKEI